MAENVRYVMRAMKKKRFSRLAGKMLCGVSLCLGLSATAQDSQESDPFASGGGSSDDPFAASYSPRIFRKGSAKETLLSGSKQVCVMVEMIEVDHLTANEMMLKFGKNANDVGVMREALMELVKKKEARLQETLWGRSPLNKVGKIEAIVEKIYPTEYDPPELPNVVGGTSDDQEGVSASAADVKVPGDLYTGATPTAFETRNIGTNFEFEAAESVEHPGKIGLALYLEVSRFLQNG